MRAIGYIRVSTEDQAKEGVSLEAQMAAIRAYTELKGMDLCWVSVDAGVTTKIPLEKREGGADLIGRLDNDMAVVSYKLDRMFRNTIECLSVIEQWEKRGVSVHFIDLGGQAVDTRSATGRFVLTVLAAVAEMEKNQLRERTSAALQHKKKHGEYTGGRVPYGYRNGDGTLQEDKREQEAIEMAVKLRRSGKSLRRIGEFLAEVGYLPRNGGKWHASQVRLLVAE